MTTATANLKKGSGNSDQVLMTPKSNKKKWVPVSVSVEDVCSGKVKLKNSMSVVFNDGTTLALKDGRNSNVIGGPIFQCYKPHSRDLKNSRTIGYANHDIVTLYGESLKSQIKHFEVFVTCD